MTLPDGSDLTYVYDTAHRLTGITDLFSQQIVHARRPRRPDATRCQRRWQCMRQHCGSFDALGRMLQDIGGAGQTTTYAYDANGNALTITDR